MAKVNRPEASKDGAAARKGQDNGLPKTSASSETTVTVNRRESKDRRDSDRRQKNAPVEIERRKTERRVKVNRRRQIDPTTCERDYSDDEVEFMSALDAYKRSSGRMFPTCSEILEVLRGLGYEKRKPEAPIASAAVVETPQTNAG